MRPLTPSDPSAIGGHRLLGRLGAGGMGTVYLGRTPAGILVALKVIRAEHAADPGFRARFRREAAIAARVRSPWVVEVTGADPEAREPWLATPFVPAPSLAEAVALHGPLPVPTVRILGARLAEALTAVHDAGMVHRDVKPGNILLALDGPRLIDFGIARLSGGTALTVTDALVGTPGYLAPEQARATGPGAGPAADVFALGCVLCFAATGRGPFGTGHPAAVVYRTVHDDPGLDAVPAELAATVAACLAKDPGLRPTAEEVRRTLTAAADPARDWLPPALPRLIAERSARALDLPAPEPTRGGPAEPVTAVDGPAAGRRPGRRALLATGALVALGAPVLWLTTRPDSGGTPTAPASRGPVPLRTLGLQADLSGPGRAGGLAHRRGAQLAVDRHNARPDKTFRLALRVADDRGTADGARRAAAELVADPAVLGVLGPTWPGAAEPLAVACDAAGLPLLVVSQDAGESAALSVRRTVCLTRPDDDVLSIPVIHYLSAVRRSPRTCVVYDPQGGALAEMLARDLREAPPAEGAVTVHELGSQADPFPSAAAAVRAARADGVVYAGTAPARAGRLARALAAAGFTGARAALQHVMTPAFLEEAGPAAEGWVFAALFIDPVTTATPAAREFTAAHRAAYRTAPGRWAAEAHDAVGLLATALGGLTPDDVTRPALAVRVFNSPYDGIAKRLEFVPVTHLIAHLRTSFLYRAERGAFRALGTYLDVPTEKGS
ncbi:bifunctional serine/threonine-protein kinase/ABC transporter substrate-binding protein [Streptomyces bambusae]|uniref:bifunctional serine/threonine-protein kinase/ABC transporter substrate-binding protein n=1 Tax=Streptomyces bambusae TaxID=1550616 RepID=UPI001CFD0487|nr:bifunctional serine/threonine-protein kinase/ABC transporter substrate-binding protein [Streptomyces bambusae]MCB5165429.1 bifunctional serine/threonine-protein kinase/ABC transporter substrate-binding protein [Streptomyces bambusae]